MELFTCTQAEREPLWDFWRKFVQLRARTPNIIDDAVILEAINGVRLGPCSSMLMQNPPKTIAELHEAKDMYIGSDTILCSKTMALKPQTRLPLWPPQRNQYPRNEPINVNTIESTVDTKMWRRDQHTASQMIWVEWDQRSAWLQHRTSQFWKPNDVPINLTCNWQGEKILSVI